MLAKKQAARVGRPKKADPGTPQVRDLILDAAEEVFAEKGVSGAGLREIAKRSGRSLAIVTYYFKTKDRLAVEVFQRHLKSHREAISGVVEKNSGKLSLEGLQKILRETSGWYISEKGLKAYRIQLSSKHEASRELETTAKQYWTECTAVAASIIRALNPKLNEADSLERSIFLMLLLRVRTELHWIYAKNSGQIKDRDTLVKNYEDWFLNRILKVLIEDDLP